MDEKVLTKTDLQKRFETLSGEIKKAQVEYSQIQSNLQAKSVNINHIQGAMQDTIDLMVQLIGEEEVKKFVDELNKPKE